MGAASLSSNNIIGSFFARLEQDTGEGYINRIATVPFESDQAQEEYKWLGQAPAMREWVGGRQAKGLREAGFIIKNKVYESTMEVTLDEIRRDKTQQVMIRVNEQADRANAHWNKLASALINAGETGLCYDGQYFFDTDHLEGDSGTQSNDIGAIAAVPALPTAAEYEAAILKAIETILGFKDDQGEPMNENAMEFTVMVPITHMARASAALNSPVIADGSGSRTNVLASFGGFMIRLVANPRLTWTTKFAVFRSDGSVKPIIRQEEVPLEVSAVAEGSELEFNERIHRYGISAIRAADYGYWQHSVLTTFAVS